MIPPLEPLSQFLDYYLQPLVLKASSFIKDTKDFIAQVEGVGIPENATLVTLDVTLLYTSIPHQEAYQVIAHALTQRTEQSPPAHFLLQLLELIL